MDYTTFVLGAALGQITMLIMLIICTRYLKGAVKALAAQRDYYQGRAIAYSHLLNTHQISNHEIATITQEH